MVAVPRRTSGPGTIPAEDLRLVAGLRSGDSESHAQLVKRYGPRMLAVARRLMRNENEARDCLRAAFAEAFRAIEQFQHDSSLSTWLNRIVVDAALTKLCARGRRAETSFEEWMPRFDADGWRIESEVKPHPPADRVTEDGEIPRLVRSTINVLPELYRNLILLRDVEGYSSEETAALLGLTPAAVKNGLHRARTALKSLLESTLR